MKIEKGTSVTFNITLLMMTKNMFGIQKPKIWVARSLLGLRMSFGHFPEENYDYKDKAFIDYIKRK